MKSNNYIKLSDKFNYNRCNTSPTVAFVAFTTKNKKGATRGCRLVAH